MLSRQLNGPHLYGFISETAFFLRLEVDHLPSGRHRRLGLDGDLGVKLGRHVGGSQAVAADEVEDVKTNISQAAEESACSVSRQHEEGTQKGKNVHRDWWGRRYGNR